MGKRMNIETFIERFNNGDFDKKDMHVQVEAGWYDWFCKTSSLPNKTKRMGNIIKQFNSNGKIDLKKNCVVFKNNCPFSYPMYDDFRIADLETGENIFVVTIESPLRKRYAIYSRDNGFSTPIFETKYSREVVRWFNCIDFWF
jgi:hypothetical protein